MVKPPSNADNIAKISDFLIDLTKVSFDYKNGTSVTFTGESLNAWVHAYKTLLQLQLMLFGDKNDAAEPPTPPTNLANELKKRS